MLDVRALLALRQLPGMAEGPRPLNEGRLKYCYYGRPVRLRRRACDAEFLHAVAQGVGMEAEDLGGAAGAVDDPVGLLEDGEDVVTLHGFKRLADRTWSQMNTIVGLTRLCPRS